MSECKCDMRTKLVGDGCSVCNPELALHYAQENIEELEQDKTDLELASTRRNEMKDKINIGDSVRVYFSTHPPIHGIVQYIPIATGDSWRLTEETNGVVIYIQQFDYMVKK